MATTDPLTDDCDAIDVRLDAVAIVEPLYQGEFDGLCGVYAVLNALQLLFATTAPLGYDVCESLFRRGVAFLAAEERLASTISWGTSIPLWHSLTDHLVSYAAHFTARGIQVVRPFGNGEPFAENDAVGWIEQTASARRPILLMWRETRSHYTVVSGITARRILLADSMGRRWLERRSCIAAGGKLARYRLVPASFTTLELE